MPEAAATRPLCLPFAYVFIPIADRCPSANLCRTPSGGSGEPIPKLCCHVVREDTGLASTPWRGCCQPAASDTRHLGTARMSARRNRMQRYVQERSALEREARSGRLQGCARLPVFADESPGGAESHSGAALGPH